MRPEEPVREPLTRYRARRAPVGAPREERALASLRQCLDAANSNFQGLPRMLFFAGVGMKKLLLQLVPRKIVDDLTYVFRAIACGVDHAGDDERELNLEEERLRRPVEVARHQFARTGRVSCIHHQEPFSATRAFAAEIQLDRRLQQFPATSLETKGRNGAFWDEDDDIGIGQASIARRTQRSPLAGRPGRHLLPRGAGYPLLCHLVIFPPSGSPLSNR